MRNKSLCMHLSEHNNIFHFNLFHLSYIMFQSIFSLSLLSHSENLLNDICSIAEKTYFAHTEPTSSLHNVDRSLCFHTIRSGMQSAIEQISATDQILATNFPLVRD